MLLDDRVKVIEYSKETDNAVINNTRSYMELLNPYSYEKGGWILHMLHRDLGDSVFWKTIRKYYATYAGKTADTEDLRAVFESVSGKNLKQFFQQWLFTPGLPILEMKWKYNSKLKTVALTIIQKQLTEFRFPINIQLHYKSGKKADQNIMVDGRSKSIILKVSEKPSMIIADPYTSLLFEGTINEVK
jgi:aminopeptidase N